VTNILRPVRQVHGQLPALSPYCRWPCTTHVTALAPGWLATDNQW